MGKYDDRAAVPAQYEAIADEVERRAGLAIGAERDSEASGTYAQNPQPDGRADCDDADLDHADLATLAGIVKTLRRHCALGRHEGAHPPEQDARIRPAGRGRPVRVLPAAASGVPDRRRLLPRSARVARGRDWSIGGHLQPACRNTWRCCARQTGDRSCTGKSYLSALGRHVDWGIVRPPDGNCGSAPACRPTNSANSSPPWIRPIVPAGAASAGPSSPACPEHPDADVVRREVFDSVPNADCVIDEQGDEFLSADKGADAGDLPASAPAPNPQDAASVPTHTRGTPGKTRSR